MYTSDTIVSFITSCNGPVSGIRVSGERSLDVLRKIFIPEFKKKDIGFTARKVYLGDFVSENGFIDQGTAVFFKGPASYTGEDCFEIFFHGTHLISRLIIDAIIHSGVRIADAGEFTRRAFLNSKMDLLQAEAVSELYQTRNEKALSLVYNNLKGTFSKEINEIREKLVGVISGIEAYLDFPEDEIEAGNTDTISKEVRSIQNIISNILKNRESSDYIRNGYRIALFGLVNSGKSSILNQLLKEDRAIITDIPGTTRDIIEGEISIKGILYRFFDMAGMRWTSDTIEKIGIKKALKMAKNSDLILFVTDISLEDQELNNKLEKKLKKYKHLTVKNKCDLKDIAESENDSAELLISAKTGVGFDRLIDDIYDMTAGDLKMDDEMFLINERQKSHLLQTIDSLGLSLETIENGYTLDCVSVDLYDALNYLREIIGEVSTEDILDRVFSSFCIGK